MAFDTTALEREMSREERNHYRQLARSGAFGSKRGGAVGATVTMVVMLAMGAVMVPLFWSIGRTLHLGWLYRLWPVIFLALTLVACVFVVRSLRRSARTWPKVAALASANGLGYRRGDDVPDYPSLVFQRARGGRLEQHVYSNEGIFADCGTLSWTEGSGEDRESFRRTYAAFRLPRSLPHLVLKDRWHGGGLNGIALGSRQRVRLGEPFDSRFTAFAPAGYAPDAFLLLPPHVMEQLQALPQAIDVEVVDDWLFLVANSALDPARVEAWRVVGEVQDLLGTRVEQLWDRYRDPRLAVAQTRTPGDAGTWPSMASGVAGRGAASGVAPEGRRLQTTWSVTGLVSTAVAFAVYLALRHEGFLHVLFR